MSETQPSRPPAIVLSGGGARAAYQVGVLSAIAAEFPHAEFPILTGVSAGAINASYMAAHRGEFETAVRGLAEEWNALTPERVFRLRLSGAFPALARGISHFVSNPLTGKPAVRGLLDMSPLRSFLSECIDFDAIGDRIGAGQLRAVALSATSYQTGFTETFVQARPEVELWQRARRVATGVEITVDHVIASAAIPLVFAAVRLESGYYGDGSLRQTAPLAPAIHLGAGKILAISMRADISEPATWDEPCYPSSTEIAGLLFNSVFLDALDADAERLDRINSVLERIGKGCEPPEDLRRIELLKIRPSRDLGQLARGIEVDLPGWIPALVRAFGGARERSSDFLSYMMFDPAYTVPLLELGYDDGRAARDDVERFLSA